MKIYAVSYGEYKGCYEDDVVIPIQAGSVLIDTECIFFKDNKVKYISEKNTSYNELTAIYAVWKSIEMQDEFLGFCHYRRYFVKANSLSLFMLRLLRLSPIKFRNLKNIYDFYLSKTSRFLLSKQKDIDAVFPKKIDIPITLQQHYDIYHDASHYAKMLQIIDADFNYLSDIAHRCSNLNSGYFFNMGILKKGYFDSYCRELFRFTEKIELEFDGEIDSKHSRYIGYLSERFTNFYFHHLIENEKISYIEMDVVLINNEIYL